MRRNDGHRRLLAGLGLGIVLATPARAQPGDLNLGFEIPAANGTLPLGWDGFRAPGYRCALDSTSAHSGRLSLRMDGVAPAGQTFVSGSRVVSAAYAGRFVQLEGWLRTRGVRGDDAGVGLWLRLDEGATMLALDNMAGRRPTGDTEWTQFSVSLPLIDATSSIRFGVLFRGEGSAWVDDVRILFDGQPPERAPLRAAESDSAVAASSIRIPNRDRRTIEHLAVLGRVWGFLKYHHPAVAGGDRDWDRELLAILPQVVAARSDAARNRVLVTWYDELGPVRRCGGCADIDSVAGIAIRPSLGWLADRRTLGHDLSRRLSDLHANRYQGEQRYVGWFPGVGNPEFKHESGYAQAGYPNEGLRLLALYRYWNMIEYFFPYKDVIGGDWSTVLREFVPRFLDAANATEYRLVALELIGRVHDTHANLVDDPFLGRHKGELRPALRLRFVEHVPVVAGVSADSLGAATGVQRGDIVTAVAGEPVAAWIARNARIFPASNEPTQRRDMARDLLRGGTDRVEVAIRRGDSTFVRVLRRYAPSVLQPPKPQPMWRFVRPDVGYVYLGSIASDSLAGIFERFRDTKGLVVDLRCYPSEFVVFSMGRWLVDDPTPFVKFTRGEPGIPGAFAFGPPLQVGDDNPQRYRGKVVILVDETTQSQAEYTTMAFRTAPGALVVGSTTAGADGNVSNIVLPGGVRTRISGIGVFYPDGRPTQRIGIVPDVEVRPTIAGIRAGRDEVLDRAIALIEE